MVIAHDPLVEAEKSKELAKPPERDIRVPFPHQDMHQKFIVAIHIVPRVVVNSPAQR